MSKNMQLGSQRMAFIRIEGAVTGYNYRPVSYISQAKSQDLEGEHGSPCGGHCHFQRLYIQWGWHFFYGIGFRPGAGCCPDAQLVMKVFGQNGGAYDSDYMAAIGGRHCFGADSVNLSLGSTSPGFTRARHIREVMDRLTESDTVVGDLRRKCRPLGR